MVEGIHMGGEITLTESLASLNQEGSEARPYFLIFDAHPGNSIDKAGDIRRLHLCKTRMIKCQIFDYVHDFLSFLVQLYAFALAERFEAFHNFLGRRSTASKVLGLQ